MPDNGTSRTEVPADHDDRDNNLIAAGAVLALLTVRGVPAGLLVDPGASQTLTTVEIVTDAVGNVTNQIDIGLSFMRSPYRITVERVTDGDDQ